MTFLHTLVERRYVGSLSETGIKIRRKILEIGFGTGHCLTKIAKIVGVTGKVYGVDLSEEMMSRFVLNFDDLESVISNLTGDNVSFRNDTMQGPGCKMSLCKDPSGNVIELFQPARVFT